LQGPNGLNVGPPWPTGSRRCAGPTGPLVHVPGKAEALTRPLGLTGQNPFRTISVPQGPADLLTGRLRLQTARPPCPTNSRSASPCVLKIARIEWSRGYPKGAPTGRAIGSGTKRWKTTRGSSWSAISVITPPKGAPRISSHATRRCPSQDTPSKLVKRMSRPWRVVLLRSKG
jgi:hypothetical protein